MCVSVYLFVGECKGTPSWPSCVEGRAGCFKQPAAPSPAQLNRMSICLTGRLTINASRQVYLMYFRTFLIVRRTLASSADWAGTGGDIHAHRSSCLARALRHDGCDPFHPGSPYRRDRAGGRRREPSEPRSTLEPKWQQMHSAYVANGSSAQQYDERCV